MEFAAMFLASILLFCSIYRVESMMLDIFADKDRHGQSIRLDVSEEDCTNFPVAWARKTVSLNTFGTCVQFYDQPFCKGKLTVIQPYHTVHQMDLSLVNFEKAIQSASPCGAKIQQGRYVIQNAADATILTVESKLGYFSKATTKKASTAIAKAQQWEVLKQDNNEYFMKPREHEDNYPVTYDQDTLLKGKIKRKHWKIISVGRGRYLIKHEPTQRCLYKTDEDNDVEEHDCRIWSPNQEWIFRDVIVAQPIGGLKNAEKAGIVGPGVNLNILSKVTSYKPTRPPLIIDITTENPILKKRPSFSKPYTVVHKKIKQGPIPLKSQGVKELSHYLSPPGLRPAIPGKIANNNNFLLLKHHKKPQIPPPFKFAPAPTNPPKTNTKEDDSEEDADLNSSAENSSEEKEVDYADLLKDYDAMGDYDLAEIGKQEQQKVQDTTGDVTLVFVNSKEEKKSQEDSEDENSNEELDEGTQLINANRVKTNNKYPALPGPTENHGLQQYSMFGENKPTSQSLLNSIVSQVRQRLPFFRSENLDDTIPIGYGVTSTTAGPPTTEKSMLYRLFTKIGR